MGVVEMLHFHPGISSGMPINTSAKTDPSACLRDIDGNRVAVRRYVLQMVGEQSRSFHGSMREHQVCECGGSDGLVNSMNQSATKVHHALIGIEITRTETHGIEMI